MMAGDAPLSACTATKNPRGICLGTVDNPAFKTCSACRQYSANKKARARSEAQQAALQPAPGATRAQRRRDSQVLLQIQQAGQSALPIGTDEASSFLAANGNTHTWGAPFRVFLRPSAGDQASSHTFLYVLQPNSAYVCNRSQFVSSSGVPAEFVTIYVDAPQCSIPLENLVFDIDAEFFPPGHASSVVHRYRMFLEHCARVNPALCDARCCIWNRSDANVDLIVFCGHVVRA